MGREEYLSILEQNGCLVPSLGSGVGVQGPDIDHSCGVEFLGWGKNSLFTDAQRRANENFYQEVAIQYADHRAWTDQNTRAIESGLLAHVVEDFRLGDRVLVIGTGTGRDQSLLQAVGNEMGFEVVGLDPSFNMLKQAQRKMREKNGGEGKNIVNLIQTKPGSLPFTDKSIDYVYCEAAGEHMDSKDLRILLPEIRRIIRVKDVGRRSNMLFNLRLGDSHVAGFKDGFGERRFSKYFSTYTTRQIRSIFEGNEISLVRSWQAQGGTPSAENYCPWFDALWDVQPLEK